MDTVKISRYLILYKIKVYLLDLISRVQNIINRIMLKVEIIQ